MKTLPQVKATAEQLPLISQNRLGVEVIRGAAGSGKTSTALLRLRSLTYMFEERRARQDRIDPVRVLVLTFNRTLRGYIASLAETQLTNIQRSEIVVDTFAHWSVAALGKVDILDSGRQDSFIASRVKGFSLSSRYIANEVDYLLGRFEPDNLDAYVTQERSGRGAKPRVTAGTRRDILDNVVAPYRDWKASAGLMDWNDLAVAMSRQVASQQYDVVVVDEAQDFSANQLRAIRKHVAEDHAVTFVTDTVQRIYARGYSWQESGFAIQPNRYHTLSANHRNTVEIATFAAGILSGLSFDEDGALPDLSAATRRGRKPRLVKGLYSEQVAWTLKELKRINLEKESVAFLQHEGRSYFNFLKAALEKGGFSFVEITRNTDWPEGDVNIALSTFHSAKGLEFDHVFILGLSKVNTSSTDEDADDHDQVLRRLFAVAVARARETVVVGSKQGEESFLLSHLAAGSFEEIIL